MTPSPKPGASSPTLPHSTLRVSTLNVIRPVRKHSRVNRASHRISMQMGRYLIVKSLIPLSNSTGSGVPSCMRNGFGEGRMCWPSPVSITSRGNTGPKGGSYNKRWDLSQFCGSRVLHQFLLITLFSLHCCPATSIWVPTSY